MRLLVALVLAVLAFGAVGLATAPAPASAQLIDNTPQTKSEARAARDAAESADSGGDVPLYVWLGLASLIVIGGAAFLIFRDAGTVADLDERRAGPARRPVEPGSGRAVPKAMFEGEGSSANRIGKNKKREVGKRQKQARRANRPKR